MSRFLPVIDVEEIEEHTINELPTSDELDTLRELELIDTLNWSE